MIGVLSELDCLRMLASDEFYQEEQGGVALVGQFTTCGLNTIATDLGVCAISHYFLTTPTRRLSVLERRGLVGQVSRRDVPRGMEEVSRKRLVRNRYADDLQPA
jgi:hypothetical protein